MNKFPRLGCKLNANGREVGIDPRTLTAKEVREIGHQPQHRFSNIIARHCFECSGDSHKAVTECTATECKLWPYRKGHNPFASNKGSHPADLNFGEKK